MGAQIINNVRIRSVSILYTVFIPYLYRIYSSINRPGRFLLLDLESGRLFEAGRLLNFHHFQQVRYIYFATNHEMLITKRKQVTKQGFRKIL